VLDGSKWLVYDGPLADRLLLTAGVAGEAGYSVFLVDRNSAGITRDDYTLIDGTRACDISFQGLRVTGDQRVCAGAAAVEVVEEALDRLVLGRVAEALGAMETVMQLTAEHLRNRAQFGQPLAKFQALQHRMAEMFIEVQETRSILYRGLAYIEAAPAQRRIAVSAAKVVAVKAARIVGGQGIQLHGGVGMTDEYAVGHYFKRLIAIEKAFGDQDFHLARLAATYRVGE
jgi:alkylation response protein AidB-like acyl-CoA dehydrogenase